MSIVIRELRATRGVTQEQLAKRAKLARGYLAQLEAGHKVNPSLPTLRRLAKALRVSVTELLG
jgi:transcriptional regulator with XRE-family HTH domain